MVHAESQSIKVTEILAHYFDTLSTFILSTSYILFSFFFFIKNPVLIFFLLSLFPHFLELILIMQLKSKKKTHSIFCYFSPLKCISFIQRKLHETISIFSFFRPSNFFCRPVLSTAYFTELNTKKGSILPLLSFPFFYG